MVSFHSILDCHFCVKEGFNPIASLYTVISKLRFVNCSHQLHVTPFSSLSVIHAKNTLYYDTQPQVYEEKFCESLGYYSRQSVIGLCQEKLLLYMEDIGVQNFD
ncbi:hypothetical protein AVEN_137873-1 [Araneus ventricosus]|uniref:Uncharacterized protein n=1 Tax=Araneus ventricosus TaxID=182803 RepID=A0A4Y2NW79_ARAVE|nr:hypothetical protein AVEN_137873-1 [Araneus ventricosus]